MRQQPKGKAQTRKQLAVHSPKKRKGLSPTLPPRDVSSSSESGSGGVHGGDSDDSDEDDDDEDDDLTAEERQFLLEKLMAHGRAAMGLDEPANGESSEQGRRRLSRSEDNASGSQNDEDDEEEEDSDDGGGLDDSEEDDDEGPELDDGWTGGVPVQPEPRRIVPEVVFADAPGARKETDQLSKAERRAFLNGNSAKLMGIPRETDTMAIGAKRKRKAADADEEADDQSNIALDKTLHSMLLNNLLPTQAADQAARPVDKRNAVSSRLMELAQRSLPGEGHKTLEQSRHSKHPAKIRAGILKAQAKREGKAREEAEAAGSYVRGLGGLGDGGKKRDRGPGREDRASLGELKKKKGMDGTKGMASRDRGLSNGFGKFEGGMLKLSERDIARGANVGGGRRGGGRAGKRGRR